MSPESAPTTTLIAVNLASAGFFILLSANCCWIEPELADVPGANGGAAFIWAVQAIPVAALAWLFDASFAAWCCMRRLCRGRWPANRWCWGVVPIWASTLLVDNLHHGI
ncbi:hypothetical protein ACQ859_25685 [Roseateles chitinivorans]|uniref:hypothetical protein n=1 Tax=Roseateles chitinivorans TaxID=2917965 RepID=UPI003D67F86B